MSPERKLLARKMFKLLVHEANGYAYESLFARVMQYARPQLLKIKPYGNQGDRGNDAYEKDHGRYFQIFAPEEPTASKQDAITKAETDFEEKLLPYWGGFCTPKEYFFVFNDKYSGTNFPIQQTLSSIKTKHGLNVADVYLAQHLEQEFISLEEDQITSIIGGILDPDSAHGLDYGVLGEVISFIAKTAPDHSRSGKLVAPDINEKIKFNNLNLFGKVLLSKQLETWQIDDYFSRNSEFAKSALRDDLASFYEESILNIPDSSYPKDEIGDLRFLSILQRIAPQTDSAANDRLKQDAALVIMAKYFESCDIFEEPLNAHA